MTLQIAKITLPLYIEASPSKGLYPDATPAKAAHDFIEYALLNTFGGYTQTMANGAWKDDDGAIYRDESYVYEVAIEPTPLAIAKFRDIATNAGQLAGQLAVAIVLPSNVFEIIKL